MCGLRLFAGRLAFTIFPLIPGTLNSAESTISSQAGISIGEWPHLVRPDGPYFLHFSAQLESADIQHLPRF